MCIILIFFKDHVVKDVLIYVEGITSKLLVVG